MFSAKERSVLDVSKRQEGRKVLVEVSNDNELISTSAAMVFTHSQVLKLLSITLLLIICSALNSRLLLSFLLCTSNFVYLYCIFFRTYLFFIGYNIAPKKIKRSNICDKDLPIYTVLVPLFQESNVIRQLFDNLSAIKYPKEKLEILPCFRRIRSSDYQYGRSSFAT